jgi:hypothetical protein
VVRSSAADGVQPILALAHIVDRRLAGQRLDPAHAGRHRALIDDLQHADIAGIGDMGAAA